MYNQSDADLENPTASIGELLAKLVEAFSQLLQLPNIHSFNHVDRALEQTRKITNKPVHVFSIILAMLICLVIFSAQLWDIAITDCIWNEDQTMCYKSDPDDAFARDWVYGIVSGISDRKIIILVSSPIAFILSTILLSLMTKPTALRLVQLYLLHRL